MLRGQSIPPHPLRRHTWLPAVGLVALVMAAHAAPLPRLKPDGGWLVNEAGERVVLKGCNLGTWLLIEPWMLAASTDQVRDQYAFISALEARCGTTRAAELMELFRTNWITPREFTQLKTFGFNLVRVPFHYSLLMDDERPLVLRPDAFKWLDRAVEMAEEAGVYVILDLHGAPGGQSVDGPTGRVNINQLWTDPARQEQTAWLWQRIAEHFRGRPTVVAYDLLNEPWSDFRTNVNADLLKLVARLYDSIREVDADTLTLAPGSLQGIAFYGNPTAHGWKNVGFTEHFYPGLFGQGSPSLETHARFLTYALAAKRQQLAALNVPYLIGEFNVVRDCVNRPELMRRYFDDFASAGWLSTMWSLRMLKPEGGIRPDNWYLLANAQPFKLPDLATGTADEFEAAFRALGTMDLAVDTALRTALTSKEPPKQRLTPAARGWFQAPAQDALPDWKSTDVATALPGGLKRLSDDDVTIYGAGADLWGNHDEFRFVYREQPGDFSVATWLTTLDSPSDFAKAGWMLRGDLTTDAPHILVHAFPNGRVMLAWRPHGGGPTQERPLTLSGLPVGLGLERKAGRLYVRFTDADRRWQRQEITETGDFQSAKLLGLIMMSHDALVLGGAAFERITLDTATEPAAPASATPSGNLLQNASFETAADAQSPDRAADWPRWGQWLNRETDWRPQRDGTCLLGYHHWQIESADDSGLYQDVTVTPGIRATFSIDAAADPNAPDKHGPDSIELRLEAHDGDRLLTVASQTYRASELAAGGNWSRLQVTGVFPTAQARVLLIVHPSRRTPRDAALKFDSAVLRVDSTSGSSLSTAPTGNSSEGGEK